MAIAHGVGTTVSIGGALTYVESVTAGGSLETAEVRALDQAHVQRVAGLIDKGSIELTGYADSANFAALVTARDSATAVACTVTGRDGSTVSFNGFVTEVKLIASASEAVKFSATIVASGT
jgi:hypothetical protein